MRLLGAIAIGLLGAAPISSSAQSVDGIFAQPRVTPARSRPTTPLTLLLRWNGCGGWNDPTFAVTGSNIRATQAINEWCAVRQDFQDLGWYFGPLPPGAYTLTYQQVGQADTGVSYTPASTSFLVYPDPFPPPLRLLRIEPAPIYAGEQLSAILLSSGNGLIEPAYDPDVSIAGNLITVRVVESDLALDPPSLEEIAVPIGKLSAGHYTVVYQAVSPFGLEWDPETLDLVVASPPEPIPALGAIGTLGLGAVALMIGLFSRHSRASGNPA